MMADAVALLKLEEKLPSYAVMLFRYYHYIILEYVVVLFLAKINLYYLLSCQLQWWDCQHRHVPPGGMAVRFSAPPIPPLSLAVQASHQYQ